MAIIGDQNAAVGRDLQSVWPAVILENERPFAVGRYLKNAAEGNVDDVEMAGGVE